MVDPTIFSGVLKIGAFCVGMYLQYMVVAFSYVKIVTPTFMLQSEMDWAAAFEMNDSSILTWFLVLILFECFLATTFLL